MDGGSGAGWLLAAGGGHGEGFFENARGRGRKVVGGEIGLGRPGDVGHVAAGAGFTGDAFTQVIHDDKVEARARAVFSRLAPGFMPWFIEDALEHFNQFDYADPQASLFFQFAARALFECFAGFERAAGNRPMAFERFAAAADEQGASLLDDHAADSDHGALRIFSAARHSVPQGCEWCRAVARAQEFPLTTGVYNTASLKVNWMQEAPGGQMS